MEKIQKYQIAQLRALGSSKLGDLAAALGRMVNVFVLRGEYSKALPVVEEALSLSLDFHGENSHETAAQVPL